MIRRAKNIVGSENVDMALSLVVAEKDVQKAIDYVLGDVFVCSDMDAAKRVTFDPQIRRKSVTLDGQTFDPAGTLRGGRFYTWWARCLEGRGGGCVEVGSTRLGKIVGGKRGSSMYHSSVCTFGWPISIASVLLLNRLGHGLILSAISLYGH